MLTPKTITAWFIASFNLFFSNIVLAASFDETVEAYTRPFAEGLAEIVFFKLPILGHPTPIIVLWLVAAAAFFTLYLGFINIRGFGYAIRHLRGEYDQPKASGEISHFQAVSTAVSGTVGIGNIGGVAVAIGMGGPGAVFWLMLAGFLGMSTKLVECTLSVKYRVVNEDGSVSGGPMYYLEHWLALRNWPAAGKMLGGFYAIALVIGCFGIGNMFQSNQAYVQFLTITGGSESFFTGRGWLFGGILALVVGGVVIGGIKSIANVASKIVPLMAVLYVGTALIIIGMSYEHIPAAISMIFTEAFSSQSVAGGAMGALVIGFQRAAFSNEAGLGTAGIAHSAVQTDEPASEGLVSLLEPFLDTIVICFITSMVILTTAYPNGLMDSGLEGIALTSAAFAHHLSLSPYAIALAGLLFAFSTMLAWSYYGLKAWTYLMGESSASKLTFNLIFCAFVAIGCMVQLDSILSFSDSMVFLIALPNIIGLYLYGPEVKREVTAYLNKLKEADR